MIKVIESYISEKKSEERTVRNSLIKLILHMLKCKYQNEYKDKSSWRSSIISSQDNLVSEFKGIGKGSLYNTFYKKKMDFKKVYSTARKLASNETKKSIEIFPEECEWSLDDFISDDFIQDFIDEYGEDK